MGRFQDLTGQKFGRLTVIERAENKGKRTMWLCKCECGNVKVIPATNLKREEARSCGCLSRELAKERATKHGIKHKRLYNIWGGMKKRCYNEENEKYPIYGGRGIAVCEEWKDDFQAFYDWAMANGYSDSLTIDRIDNDGDYSPSNCRWATNKEQQNNKRNNHCITYNGKTQTVAKWAEELGMKSSTLYQRLTQYKWSVEKALITPVIGVSR